MKILVVSDTHRKNNKYFEALQRVRPDLIIHCGDVEGSEYALTESADCPVKIVLGNNDFFSYLPKAFSPRGRLSIISNRIIEMYKHFTIGQKLAAEELYSRDASGTVRLYREGNFYVSC